MTRAPAGASPDLPEPRGPTSSPRRWGRLTFRPTSPASLVARHRPTLDRDLGETHGTVAVRTPSHPVALDLLAETGPMAVSSANLTRQPSPQDCDAAHGILGDPVAVYLDGGPTAAAVASSIVGLTGWVSILKRAGAINAERLLKVVPDLQEP